MHPIIQSVPVRRYARNSRSTRTSWRVGSLACPSDESSRLTEYNINWFTYFHPTKLHVALTITIFFIISQILIIHHYFGLNGNLFRPHGISTPNQLQTFHQHEWFCRSLQQLYDIAKLASSYEVDLVIIDPDFLSILEELGYPESAVRERDPINFSKSSSGSRASQEPGGHKSVIHIAAINETSGGQPNLKLFYNSLKHSGYIISKYDDVSETMQAEVYRRPMHLFDDDDGRSLENTRNINSLTHKDEDEEVSKIYTEFIAHMLIVNRTTFKNDNQSPCPYKSQDNNMMIIHIMILYNYEYRPNEQWIQSSLNLNELEKHRLLSYGLHLMDFRIPLEQYYIHDKRRLVKIKSQDFKLDNFVESSLKEYKLLEEDHQLRYINNTYLNCKASMFNITGLIDNTRRLSNYVTLLDEALPLRQSQFREEVMEQMRVAFKFMEIFSKTYGNFDYWITGSTLLAYHKFCEIVIMPQADRLEKLSRSPLMSRRGREADDLVVDDHRSPLQALRDDVVINLEMGLLAEFLNLTMLEDLSKSNMIGVTMISDWSKPDGHISFHVSDCPNLIINLYPYELRRDFYQYYFITRNSMIMNHRFRKKRSSAVRRNQTAYNSVGEHHHVFTTRNLDLCLTRIDKFHPFKVPCDVHDHLRRIYII